MRLVERALLKDIIGMARADTGSDNLLDAMLEAATDEVMRLTRRQYLKGPYTEYYKSYEQLPSDPTSQWIWVDVPPFDTQASITVSYSSTGNHDTDGSILTVGKEYAIGTSLDHVEVFSITVGSGVAFVPYFGYAHNPRGFKITYTGGYAASADPVGDDPMDEPGVVQVPAGLKMVIASKIAKDFRKGRILQVWDEDDRRALRPYMKKDQV